MVKIALLSTILAFSLGNGSSLLADKESTIQAAAPDAKTDSAQPSNEKVETAPATVPSGKRHRTHVKRHRGAQTTGDSRTIQSDDPPTPAK